MALPIRRLFVDFDTGQIYRNFNDLSTVPAIYFTKGDDISMDVVAVRQTGTPEFPMESIPMTYASYGDSVMSFGSKTYTIWSDNAAMDIPQPTLTMGTTVGSFFSFSIDSTPSYGSFTLTITKSSPALNVTTKPIAFPFSTTDVETAVKNAINSASGWSSAFSVVIPTGPLSGNIQAYGYYSGTGYDLATTSGSMSSTSQLYGFKGLRFNPTDSAGNVSTYLDGESEKAAILELKLSFGKVQTIAQYPMIIRDTVG